MDKYLELEWNLAEALGYQQLEVQKCGIFDEEYLVGVHPTNYSTSRRLPRWVTENKESFSLLLEYDVDLCLNKDGDAPAYYFDAHEGTGPIYVFLHDHPDKETAARWFIAKVVLAKLKAIKERQ